MGEESSQEQRAPVKIVSEPLLVKRPPEPKIAKLHIVWNLHPTRSDFDLDCKYMQMVRGRYLRKMIAHHANMKSSDIKLSQLRGWRLTDRETLTNIPDYIPDQAQDKEVFRFVDEKGNVVKDRFVDRERWMEIYNETPLHLAPTPWRTQIVVVSTNARQILELILVQLSSS